MKEWVGDFPDFYPCCSASAGFPNPQEWFWGAQKGSVARGGDL